MKYHVLIPILVLRGFLSHLSAAPPNFLLLLSDDQAWNGLSCRMHPEIEESKHRYVQTPNLARLASQGMRFSAAYSPASVCSPTRISLQTGKSPAQCNWTKAAASMRAEDGFKLIPPQGRRNIESDEVTIGELLQSAGYATAHYGKWHIGGGGPEKHGYDESDGDTGNGDAEPHVEPNPVDIFGMGKRAGAFMEKTVKAGRPFFVQMSYHALHYPQNATRALVEKYKELNPRGNEKEIGRAAIAADLDRGIGELIGKIDELGIAENTYVIYMSDNGGSTRNFLKGGKGGVWEGGIRVPFIVRGPGIEADSWCHRRIVGYDLFPTLCQLAGVTESLPSTIEGGNIAHLFAGKDEPVKRPREEVVFHFPHYQGDTPHTALFLGNHKLIRFYEDNSLLLYDVSRDISERNNLVDQMPGVTKNLEERMNAYLAMLNAQMPIPNPKFDPDNPPVLKEMRGEKKGKGGKRKKRSMEEAENTSGEVPGVSPAPKPEHASLRTDSVSAREQGKKGRGKKNAKDADTWSAEEYSGLRGEKELLAALASKGFTWITGSPADNEKLSVGKNAQFFGFVALRYQSGRAANRGTLGRAVYAISSEQQRARMAKAVLAEKEALKEWWEVREEILTLLEDHLYTGRQIDRGKLAALGERFSLLNAVVATHEARAYADLEDSLTKRQKDQLTAWRADAESAGEYANGVRVKADGIGRDDLKQLEDLYAKAFSWITGKPEDNEIIPIGQPAQFFGFVSIRHKSGHAANRGKIAEDFFGMLTPEQQGFIHDAVEVQTPVVRKFLEKRHLFLKQLSSQRTDPGSFDSGTVQELAWEMGRLEMEAARIEAEAYRKIRESMSDDQVEAAMKIRGEYVIDESQVAKLDMKQRGATLSVLCAGCHGAPGMHRPGMPGPSLDGIWDRPIATGKDFEYSAVLQSIRNDRSESWTPELMDEFLTAPKKFAPGTKMEFQGLLNEEDRKALIEHMKKSR